MGSPEPFEDESGEAALTDDFSAGLLQESLARHLANQGIVVEEDEFASLFKTGDGSFVSFNDAFANVADFCQTAGLDFDEVAAYVFEIESEEEL